MGEGDHIPIGGHRRKADPKHAKKIREGGKKADEIRKRTEAQHETLEVPAAEEELQKDLEEIPNGN